MSAIPELIFPSIPNVESILLSRGLEMYHANLIGDQFTERIKALQENVKTCLHKIGPSILRLHALSSQLSTKPPSLDLIAAYSNTMEAWLAKALDTGEILIQRSKGVNTVPSDVAHSEVVPETCFNQDYTPFLLKFFEYNAYPSVKDRQALAKKSGMSSRQIQIWFQNHRRRARQEGQELVRRHPGDALPAELSQKFIEKELPAITTVREQAAKKADEEFKYSSITALKYPINPSLPDIIDTKYRPSYGFPTPFDKEQVDKAFPCKSGPSPSSFSPPIWRRTPAKPKPEGKTPVDIRAFRKAFALLTVRDGKLSDCVHPPAATFAITHIPQPAPLPAFAAHPRQYLPFVILSDPQPAVKKTKKAKTKTAKAPRKVAGPPRRVPTSQRDVSPTESVSSSVSTSSLFSRSTSPSSSSSPSSPSSSRSISPETLHRKASFSSNESVSAPTTPEHSVVSLPSYAPSIAGVDDYQNLFSDNYNDAVAPQSDTMYMPMPMSMSMSAYPQTYPTYDPLPPFFMDGATQKQPYWPFDPVEQLTF